MGGVSEYVRGRRGLPRRWLISTRQYPKRDSLQTTGRPTPSRVLPHSAVFSSFCGLRASIRPKAIQLALRRQQKSPAQHSRPSLFCTPPRPPRSATTGYPTGRTPPQSSSEGPQSTTSHPLTPFKRYSAGLSDIAVDPPLIRQSLERAIRWVRAGIRVWWLRRARLRRR